jgi:hypothetical protein
LPNAADLGIPRRYRQAPPIDGDHRSHDQQRRLGGDMIEIIHAARPGRDIRLAGGTNSGAGG